MKKIAVLFAVAAVAAISGCASPSAQLCLKQAECAGEDDPATFCQDAQDDIDADEDLKKAQDDRKAACGTEDDALANCLIANGSCDEIEGTDTKLFGLKASAADGECEDEAKASTDCTVE